MVDRSSRRFLLRLVHAALCSMWAACAAQEEVQSSESGELERSPHKGTDRQAFDPHSEQWRGRTVSDIFADALSEDVEVRRMAPGRMVYAWMRAPWPWPEFSSFSMIMSGAYKRDAKRRIAKEGIDARTEAFVHAITRCLSDTDSSVRFWAAEILGGIGPEGREAIPALETCLSDVDELVRLKAASALYEVGGPVESCVQACIALFEAQSNEVKRGAMQRLAWMMPEALVALPALRKMEQDPDLGVKRTSYDVQQWIERGGRGNEWR